MKSIKEIIHQKSVERSRSFIAEVIPKEIYETKKRRGHESFQKRQKDLMRPIALARITKTKEQEEENNMQFSL